MSDPVVPGRDAFARRAWGDAYAQLSTADQLEGADLELLAVACFLVGRDEESARAWDRAHVHWIRAGDRDRAARCAFWVGLAFLLRGEMARGGGWMGRAERLLEEAQVEGPARGYVLLPAFLEASMRGDLAAAARLAGEMIDIGRRFGDPDLVAFGVLSRGEASLALGEIARGMRLLDEVMVSVAAGEVSPIPAGIVYCAVIEACMKAFDLRRAAEWTEALAAWCAAQPDLVPYRGQCLVHRAQVLQAHGAWAEAIAEAEQACRRLSEPAHAALGSALYQLGELHRLRGEFPAAEQAYRAANAQGREPVPGLALLRLAQGNVGAALAATQRMVEESDGQPGHPALLAAAVEALLATGDAGAARAVSDRLTAIAGSVGVPLLDAMAGYAAGSVLLAEADPRAALGHLRRACQGWRDLDMPYDEARARVQIGLACRALGDEESAELEFDAAREVFARLGARPDGDRVAALSARAGPAPPAGLTSREREVLRLVAAGKTNRAIAGELVISEHTVARHLQNIFLKLDLSSRAAATAYAYEHGLV